jgi:uncharacterized membrane protein
VRAKPVESLGATGHSGPARRSGGYASLIWAVLGLAISAYLTVEHFSASTILACPESKTINCAKVTTSQWSHIFGIPVALLGLCYFVVMVALCVPPAWRIPALDRIRVGAVAVGAVSVLYLLWAELFRVDAICLWCTGVHICTIGLLTAVLWRTALLSNPPRSADSA